jgi:hypothetical protein
VKKLGLFGSTNRPECCLVFYPANSNSPLFVISTASESVQDYSYYHIDGATMESSAQITDISFKESRANSGGGLKRHTASVSILDGTPFTTQTLKPLLYSTGQGSDDFVIKAYAIDYTRTMEDLSKHCFLGIFKLDASVAYSTRAGVTTFNITSLVTSLTDKVVDLSDTVLKNLDGAGWSAIRDLPTYVGYWCKIRAGGMNRVNGGVEGIDASKILFTKSGQLQKNHTGRYMVLASSADTFFTANNGSLVKLLMSDGEIITGTVTTVPSASSGDDWYGFTGYYCFDTTSGTFKRDDALNTITATSRAITGSTMNAATSTNEFTISKTDAAKLISATGYLATANNVPVRKQSDGANKSRKVVFKLEGIGDIDANNKSLRHMDAVTLLNTGDGDVAGTTKYDPTLLGIASWSGTTQRSSYSGERTYLNYAVADGVAESVDIKLRNPVNNIVTAPPAGTRFFIYITGSFNSGLSYDATEARRYYFRSYGSSIIGSRVYANVNGDYLRLPDGSYTVATNQTFMGVDNLTKIELNRSLDSMFAKSDNAGNPIDVSVDDSHLAVDIEAPRSFTSMLKLMLSQYNTSIAHLLHPNVLNISATATENGPALSLKLTNQTWSELLDSMCYESGFTLVYADGKIDTDFIISKGVRDSVWKDGSFNYYMPLINNANKIQRSEVILRDDNINVGKVLLYKNSFGQEYTKISANITAPMEELTSRRILLRNLTGREKLDRDYSYSFNYITDSNSVRYAASLIGRIGHTAGLTESNREYAVGCIWNAVRFDAGDIAALMNLDNVADANGVTALNTIGIYDDGSGNLYSKYSDSELNRAIIPNIGVVEETEYTFGGADIVHLSVRQAAVASAISVVDVTEGATLSLPTSTAIDNTLQKETPANPSGEGNRSWLTAKGYCTEVAEGKLTKVSSSNSDGGTSGMVVPSNTPFQGCSNPCSNNTDELTYDTSNDQYSSIWCVEYPGCLEGYGADITYVSSPNTLDSINGTATADSTISGTGNPFAGGPGAVETRCCGIMGNPYLRKPSSALGGDSLDPAKYDLSKIYITVENPSGNLCTHGGSEFRGTLSADCVVTALPGFWKYGFNNESPNAYDDSFELCIQTITNITQYEIDKKTAEFFARDGRQSATFNWGLYDSKTTIQLKYAALPTLSAS